MVEMSANDPLFKEIAESYSSFRAKYKIWKDHGYLD
jgi:TRAP-type mannitol/chloroaromatic compound transport system substrate-binding protein